MAKHTLEIFRCEHCKIFKSMFGHLSTCEMQELKIISCKKFNTFRRMSSLENPEDWPTFCCSFRVARFKHEKKNVQALCKIVVQKHFETFQEKNSWMDCVFSTTVDCMKNIRLFKFYKFSKMNQENRLIFRSKKIRGVLRSLSNI